MLYIRIRLGDSLLFTVLEKLYRRLLWFQKLMVLSITQNDAVLPMA